MYDKITSHSTVGYRFTNNSLVSTNIRFLIYIF